MDEETLTPEQIEAERTITFARPDCALCYRDDVELFLVPGGRLACAEHADAVAETRGPELARVG